MPDKPPLYKQETPYSCAPACLRMVLACFGILETEEKLIEISDCMPDGTRPLGLIDAAKSYGFEETRKYNQLSIDDLKYILEQKLYPIVYVGVRLSLLNRLENHAMVVTEVNEKEVEVLDPLRGDIVLSHEAFESEWTQTKRLTILVK
ncbi:MAG: cysteine peptidase family C39 domain-containing protein [Blastocatellia bacterium]